MKRKLDSHCSVQASPDLADCQPLMTLTISNTVAQFINVAVTNHSPRFNRSEFVR